MASPKFSAAQTDVFNKILSDAVASKTTGAVFFGVTSADGPIYLHTVGMKLPDDPKSGAIDEDTVFWLCSQTKLITTIVALQLVDQGKIAFDTPVDTVLPELANPVVITARDEQGRPTATAPAQNKIAFGQLLNHSSGLAYFQEGPPTGEFSDAYSHADEDASAFVKILKGSLPGVPLKFEPGTDYVYGFSTDFVGFVVERLSGKSLEQYFQDHIFSPLGITSASFYLTPRLKNRLLPLAQRNAESGLVEKWSRPILFERDPADVGVHLGGVGLYSSQKDYLTVLRHLLQIAAGTAASPLLSRASVNSMFSPTLPPASATTLSGLADPNLGLPAGAAQYGRGLWVNTADIPGKRRSGSGAWGGWASTSFFVDPKTGVAVVFGMQVSPIIGDSTHKKFLSVLERELYMALGVAV
ncbi:beta-lactamase [Mycena olivaceomarginata]|nr:beta-lactamase [Mycena olivaceomarginata]